VFKPEWNSNENEGNITELLCEQYLPRVFQYINYWLNDQEVAEEMTLKAMKEALVKFGNCFNDERKLSAGIFKCARKNVLDYLKMTKVKPVLSGLSVQEQEVISLRLAAVLNNRMISKLLGLSESRVGTIVRESLCKLRDCMEAPA
jgi:DNA-directed RNA polymerase specialized sigma24 family protein